MKKFVSARSRYYKKSNVNGLIGHIERKFNFNKNVLPNEFIKYENVYSGDIQNEFNENLEKAKKIFFEKQHQYFQKKSNLYIEFVVPFSEEFFFQKYPSEKEEIIKSIENMIKGIEEKFKIKGLGYSLHLDEGYIREDKVFYNPHFHLSFMNFDFENSLMPWRTLKRGEFTNFQDLAFEHFKHLGFERGVSKEETKRVNLEKDDWIEFKQSQEIFEVNDKLDQYENRKMELEKILKGYENSDNFVQKVLNGQYSLKEISEMKEKAKNQKEKSVKLVLDYAYRYLNGLTDIDKTKKNLDTLNEKYNELDELKLKLLNEISTMTTNLQELKKEYTEITKKIETENQKMEKQQQQIKKGTKILTDLKTEITEEMKFKEELDRINRDERISEEITTIVNENFSKNKGFMSFDKDNFTKNVEKDIQKLLKDVKNGMTFKTFEENENLKEKIKQDKKIMEEQEQKIQKLQKIERLTTNNVNIQADYENEKKLRSLEIEKSKSLENDNKVLREQKNEVKSFFNEYIIKNLHKSVIDRLPEWLKPKKGNPPPQNDLDNSSNIQLG